MKYAFIGEGWFWKQVLGSGKPNGIVTVKIGGICSRDLSIRDELSRTKYVENRMDEHVLKRWKW